MLSQKVQPISASARRFSSHRSILPCAIARQRLGSRLSRDPDSRPSTLCRSNSDEASSSSSAFDIVFGKPAAPKELYESIAKDARSGLLEQLGRGSSMDLVLAALHLASEDDAIKTRTHIPLPVAAFSGRLDNMVSDCRVQMPAGLDPQQQLDWVTTYLFDTWGLKVAKGMEDGEYSPYRVYMHHVLAQRCGTPAATAAVLHSLLQRLMAAGAVSFTSIRVGLPAQRGERPLAVLEGQEAAVGPLVQWVSPPELLAELLDQLKRSYWSWDWPLGSASGFDACARALLGELGRAGRVNAAVGVMQATGRPFGNVELAQLATERAVLVTRAIDADGWQHAVQVRDLGAQMLHTGRTTEGLALLQSYQDWLSGSGGQLLGQAAGSTSSSSTPEPAAAAAGGRAQAAGAYAGLVGEVLLAERRKGLESAYKGGSGSGGDSSSGGPISFLPADD